MKTLLVHPCVGELGHELMLWQSHARHCAGRNDKTVVFCLKGREYLYEDFAKKIHPVTVEGGMPDKWTRTDPYDIIGMPEYQKFPSEDEIEEIFPIRSEMMLPQLKHKYIPFDKWYGLRPHETHDLLIHARNDHRSTYFGEERNWPQGKWNDLVWQLQAADSNIRIASIGTKGEAMHIKGTEDLRDIGLKNLATHMNYALLVVGPSSGPMHFASLCRCPHIVWTDKRTWNLGMGRKGTNRERYQKVWNPFDTPAFVLDHEGWQPSVTTVFDEVAHHINRLTAEGGSEARREKTL